MIGSCVLVGIFYLFTTYAADVYVGPAHMSTLGSLGGGSPWILFARQLWGAGWVVVFLAVVNSFFANGNSAQIAATRTWYAMGRIRLLPGAFERTSPRYESPVLGIVVQTLATVVIAFPLARCAARRGEPHGIRKARWPRSMASGVQTHGRQANYAARRLGDAQPTGPVPRISVQHYI